MKYRMSKPIASREVTWRERGGPERQAVLELCAPRRSSNGRDWYCAWRIRGGPSRKVSAAWGYDSAQALLHALAQMSSTLDTATETFLWFGRRSRRCGLPRSRSLLRT